MRIRLKAIKIGVDFRCNELTNYQKFKKSSRFPGELKSGEAFLFVSSGGNQLLWVLNVIEMNVQNSVRFMIDTRRWRISGGYWNPEMLADYAEECGIELIGIKKFGEKFADQQRRKQNKLRLVRRAA